MNDLFICQCNNIEHQLVLSYEPNWNTVFVSVHLVPDSFWKRIIHGIKYIFGHRCRFGDFDEFIFKKEDVDRLQKIISQIK